MGVGISGELRFFFVFADGFELSNEKWRLREFEL